MKPWLDDGDIKLAHGDALGVLRSLPAGCAQTCVTSPPYWGLRDYGTGSWTGGAADCDHTVPPHRVTPPNADGTDGFRHSTRYTQHERVPRDECGRCGARRVDDQLGLEASPDLFVERLVVVMREVWRVLRADGTLWLNLGDSYNAGTSSARVNHFTPNPDDTRSAHFAARSSGTQRMDVAGLKPKDLVGVPWRVAFALQADGWYLRSDIIWSKPNPMPESVTDRPTKAHEYVFLLAKQPKYFYDADAIREAHVDFERGANGHHVGTVDGRSAEQRMTAGRAGTFNAIDQGGERAYNPAGRNARSVWEIATQPTPEAHFATYPEALVRRCILAGTSEAGECSACGSPWVRQVERTRPDLSAYDHRNGVQKYDGAGRNDKDGPAGRISGQEWARQSRNETTGWAASCACGAPPVAQTVLDPFVGSGTTALVARKHGRRAIGVDLSAEYLAIAARRTQQLSLLGEGAA